MNEINAITSSSLLSGAAITEVSVKTSAKAESVAGTAVSSDTEDNVSATDASYYTDRVEISDEAISLASATASETVDASSADSASEASDSTISSAAASQGAPPPSKSSSSASSSSSDETYDLTRYTDYQLQQLLKSDTITQEQYNAEMSRRETEQS